MMNLQLENWNNKKNRSTDSAMLKIKKSTIGHNIHVNSFGKVNKTFCQFVVDYVSMALVFDVWWSSHSSQFAPAPYVSGVPAAVYEHMQNNGEIIVHYLQSNQVSYAGKIVLLEFQPICILTNSYTCHFAKLHCIRVTFPTGNSVFGQGPDWDMPKLKKLFSTVVKYKAKFAIGVISSFEDYEDNQVVFFIYSNFITLSLSSIGTCVV